MKHILDNVRSLVLEGVFGPGSLVGISADENADKGTQFASSVFFAKITLNGNLQKNYPIVIKTQPESAKVRAAMNSDSQFKNETVMYRDILPLLGAEKYDIFPKMYYGFHHGDSEAHKDIIILEDLRPRGYVFPKERVFLDFDHISLALSSLGKFHALSYATKKYHRDELLSKCSKLSLAKFEVERPGQDIKKSMYWSAIRAFQPVIEEGFKQDILDRALQKFKDVFDVWRRLHTIEEPYAVVCHGDFNKNNLIFKYDHATGKPMSVKMFDLQNGYYTSPAVDISFLLYMNTTKEQRDLHWDNYLKTYWTSLTSVTPDPGFTFKAFYEHFSKRAIYGFLPCSFFLPLMMDRNRREAEYYFNLPEEERYLQTMTTGGEEATCAIADIVRHLLEKNYLQTFLELF